MVTWAGRANVLISFSVEKFLQISNLNLLWHSLRLCSNTESISTAKSCWPLPPPGSLVSAPGTLGPDVVFYGKASAFPFGDPPPKFRYHLQELIHPSIDPTPKLSGQKGVSCNSEYLVWPITLGPRAFLPKERHCHYLSAAQLQNLELIFQFKYVWGFLTEKLCEGRKQFLASSTLKHPNTCRNNAGQSCFPSQSKALSPSFCSPIQNLDSTYRN